MAQEPRRLAASTQFVKPTPVGCHLSRRQFRAAMLEVERAVFLRGMWYGSTAWRREGGRADLEAELRTIAAEGAIRAGARMSGAFARADKIVFYVLGRRALDPLGSRVLQGSLKRAIRTRRWRERHAGSDALIYRTRRRDLLSQRGLASKFSLTRAQIRGALTRELQRLRDLADDVFQTLRERQRRWLIDVGLAPPHWQHPDPPGWSGTEFAFAKT